ncbi:MAG: hypothetical protein WBM13_08265 [Bacteroidia bacterium]
MEQAVNSLLKVIGIFLVILGLLGVLNPPYFVLIGFDLIWIGLFIYLIDFFILKRIKDKRIYWAVQIALTGALFIYIYNFLNDLFVVR